jgi:hypothetical protein
MIQGLYQASAFLIVCVEGWAANDEQVSVMTIRSNGVDIIIEEYQNLAQ